MEQLPKDDQVYLKHLAQFNSNSNNNNSIQFFIIYVLSQQLQGQLQTQHRADIHNYIMDTHNIKSRVDCRST
jgi:hypothetical protein